MIRSFRSRARARAASRGRLAALSSAAVLLLAACGGGRAAAPPGAPAPPPPPPRAVAPMDLGGQPVLVLPVQATASISTPRDALTAELLFALGEREPRSRWISPDELRAALRRAPGFAGDPGALPTDTYQHHGERYITDPLASVVRRYSALVDARLVLIPREARFVRAADGATGVVRLSAAVVDARSGRVVWHGEAEGEPARQPDAAAIAAAAAALATRMLVSRENP